MSYDFDCSGLEPEKFIAPADYHDRVIKELNNIGAFPLLDKILQVGFGHDELMVISGGNTFSDIPEDKLSDYTKAELAAAERLSFSRPKIQSLGSDIELRVDGDGL